MYHSVTFKYIDATRNTFTDWGLIPVGRPTIAYPEIKTNLVEVPGANNKLDLSESLTKYPVYGDRTGELTFLVLDSNEAIVPKNYNASGSWIERSQKIAEFLHGRSLSMALEDDPDWYYTGRFSVNWTSNNDGTGSTVTISYTLEPYKHYKYPSTQFDPSKFKDLSVTSTKKSIPLRKADIGIRPEVPSFQISNVGSSGVTIQCINTDLGINYTRTFNQNGTFKDYRYVLSTLRYSDDIVSALYYSGSGTLSVNFYKGIL